MQPVIDALKPFEQSTIVQLIVGIAVAGVLAWRMVDQFRKAVQSDPPPKPGQAVVEMASIADMQPFRDLVSETKRGADALERIAESFRLFNKREERDDERAMAEADRKERDEMRRLVEELQQEMLRNRTNPSHRKR